MVTEESSHHLVNFNRDTLVSTTCCAAVVDAVEDIYEEVSIK